MNKPAVSVQPDDDIGPLDEHGQQIWSPEEEAAIAHIEVDPDFRAGIARAQADFVAGRVDIHEDVVAMSAERRRSWRADRGL